MSKAALDLSNQHELELIDAMAAFSKDPYAWAMFSFPWGRGELKDFPDGPDNWQKDLFRAIRDGLVTVDEAIRIAVSSGHGIGKSAFVSMITLWALSTRENTKGIITANTETQLRTKTWPEIAKWFNLFIARHWFTYTASAIASVDPELQKTWRVDAVTWSETNTEAFAGLHNQGKRLFLIFDEASAIADKVWEVAEGALTDKDTEILWLAFGNPTRNSGRFFDCFHKMKHRWIHRQIDSRTVKVSNKKQIQKWIEDYGVDSDFVKVRVRGLFPSASDRQFIPSQLIDQARGKQIHLQSYHFAPVIIGVDPALYGSDECVIFLRQGQMCRQLAAYRKIQDDLLVAGYIAKFEDEYKADAVFIDFGQGTGIAAGGKQMGRTWTLVNFGGESSKPEYLNKRAEMWGEVRDYLKQGGVLPDDPTLCSQLSAPEYEVNLRGKTKLESKDDMRSRGMDSPDRADALALTFAFPVQKKNRDPYGNTQGRQEFTTSRNYDPFQ